MKALGPRMKFVAATTVGTISSIAGLVCQLVVEYFSTYQSRRVSFFGYFDELQSGDAAIIWLPAGILYLLIMVPIYLLILKALKNSKMREKVLPSGYVFYPMACALIGVIPSLSIAITASRWAWMFELSIFFFASGIIFGLGWWYFCERQVVPARHLITP